MLNETLKSCKKMISADIKTNGKPEIKELVAVLYNFRRKNFLKLETQGKTGLYF